MGTIPTGGREVGDDLLLVYSFAVSAHNLDLAFQAPKELCDLPSSGWTPFSSFAMSHLGDCPRPEQSFSPSLDAVMRDQECVLDITVPIRRLPKRPGRSNGQLVRPDRYDLLH